MCPLGESQLGDPRFLFLWEGRGKIIGGTKALAAEEYRVKMSRWNRRLWSGKIPNHNGSISSWFAYVEAVLRPNRLAHTFSLLPASSKCFLPVLLNNSNANHDNSSHRILEVFREKGRRLPPQGRNVWKNRKFWSVFEQFSSTPWFSWGFRAFFIGLLRWSFPT